MPIPITTEDNASCRREGRSIHWRRRALTPEHFARPAIHREKLSEIAAGFRMFVIRSRHGTGAALPHNFFHLSKRRLLAAQTQWNIKGVCLWVVRHGSPALEARS